MSKFQGHAFSLSGTVRNGTISGGSDRRPYAFGVAQDGRPFLGNFVGHFVGHFVERFERQAAVQMSNRLMRQVDDSATSMLLNIAEGNGRSTYLDQRCFLSDRQSDRQRCPNSRDTPSACRERSAMAQFRAGRTGVRMPLASLKTDAPFAETLSVTLSVTLCVTLSSGLNGRRLCRCRIVSCAKSMIRRQACSSILLKVTDGPRIWISGVF